MDKQKYEKQTSYLKAEFDGLIKRYSSDRKRHKWAALWISLVTAILAAAATILLGWQIKEPSDSEILTNLALVFNASITVLAAYQVFFNPRKLWVRETDVFYKLKDIERDFLFDLAGNEELEESKLNEYKIKITEVLKKSMENWKKDKNI